MQACCGPGCAGGARMQAALYRAEENPQRPRCVGATWVGAPARGRCPLFLALPSRGACFPM
eukprot:11743647-Alexandrium_andersonii.AAC.1